MAKKLKRKAKARKVHAHAKKHAKPRKAKAKKHKIKVKVRKLKAAKLAPESAEPTLEAPAEVEKEYVSAPQTGEQAPAERIILQTIGYDVASAKRNIERIAEQLSAIETKLSEMKKPKEKEEKE